MEGRSNSRSGSIITGLFLGISAALVAMLLVITIVDPAGAIAGGFSGPGRLLFRSFHLLAWWVPAYLLVLAGLALSGKSLTWWGTLLVNLLHIPVLTVATMVRLLAQGGMIPGGPGPGIPAQGGVLIDLLVAGFSLRGALLVTSLLLLFQGVAYVQVWLYVRRVTGADPSSVGEDTVRYRAVLPPPPEPQESREPLRARAEDPGDSDSGESDSEEAVSGEGDEARRILLGPPPFVGGDEEDFPRALGELRRWVSPEEERTYSEALPGEDPPRGVSPFEAGEDREDETGGEEPIEPENQEAREESPLLLFLRNRRRAPVPPAADDALDRIEGEPDQEEVPSGYHYRAYDPGDDFLREAAFDADADDDGAYDDNADDTDDDSAYDDSADDNDDAIARIEEPFDQEEVFDQEEPFYQEEPEEHDEDPEFDPLSAPGTVPERSPGGRRYFLPVEGVLRQYGDGRYWEIDDNTRDAAEVLRVTLEEFGIRAEVTGIRKGPVITMFEILPAPGVKLAKITNLSDNIALRLAASSVRIVAPIPGKHAVGIEIPNRQRHLVSFAELLLDDEFFGDALTIPIALGKDISGEAQIVDLAKTPHLLIAGATGSGKSVCVNSIICSVLYRRPPSEVKLILIDPKIVELKFYNDIPHLLTPVITDPKRAFQALQYLIYEMERRYALLDSMGARDIGGYNSKIKRKNMATEKLPYIVVIIDEFADLMSTSGKELESTVARLTAMSRAVGIHLVLATQRPSTDVITGLIKANIPARIAFMVASKVDSRIILDSMGAEKLLGRGDMLYTSAADPFPVRMQGAFLSEDEVERVVVEVKEFGEPDYIDDEIFIDDDDDDLETDVLEDPLMERAIEVVTTSRKASASYLQRRLKVGYNRAARMVEEMERMGLVGPQNGSKPREIISSSG